MNFDIKEFDIENIQEEDLKSLYEELMTLDIYELLEFSRLSISHKLNKEIIDVTFSVILQKEPSKKDFDYIIKEMKKSVKSYTEKLEEEDLDNLEDILNIINEFIKRYDTNHGSWKLKNQVKRNKF
jgi:hypothetical protein